MTDQHRKVFGIGLSRTGTTSLNTALTMLGIGAVHFPEDPRTQEELCAFLRDPHGALRLSILDEADGITDTPACVAYRALDAAYPGSRFILTMRDQEQWLRSCEAHWARSVEGVLAESPDAPLARYMNAIHDALYGSTHFDRDRFAAAYDRYHAQVHDHFSARPGDLLVLDITGQPGWRTLCDFLGRPVPTAAFPHDNRLVALRALGDAVAAVVGPGESAVLIDDEFEPSLPPDRRTVAFTDHGTHREDPADAEAAIARLEEVGPADWVVLLASAFWWLDFYGAFIDHLEACSSRVERTPDFVAYRLG